MTLTKIWVFLDSHWPYIHHNLWDFDHVPWSKLWPNDALGLGDMAKSWQIRGAVVSRTSLTLIESQLTEVSEFSPCAGNKSHDDLRRFLKVVMTLGTPRKSSSMDRLMGEFFLKFLPTRWRGTRNFFRKASFPVISWKMTFLRSHWVWDVPAMLKFVWVRNPN